MSSLVRNDFGSLLTEQTKRPDMEIRDKLPPSLPGQAPGPQMHHWVSVEHSGVRHTEVSGDNEAPERQTPPPALTYPGGLSVCPQHAWTPWISTTGTINFTASLSTPQRGFDAVIKSGPMGGMVIECKEVRRQLQGLEGKRKYRGIHMGPGQSSRTLSSPRGQRPELGCEEALGMAQPRAGLWKAGGWRRARCWACVLTLADAVSCWWEGRSPCWCALHMCGAMETSCQVFRKLWKGLNHG